MKKKKELTVIKRILQRINFMRKHLDYYTFKDMEQSEYKWAENSNVNSAWNPETGEQFEYISAVLFLALKRRGFSCVQWNVGV